MVLKLFSACFSAQPLVHFHQSHVDNILFKMTSICRGAFDVNLYSAENNLIMIKMNIINLIIKFGWRKCGTSYEFLKPKTSECLLLKKIKGTEAKSSLVEKNLSSTVILSPLFLERYVTVSLLKYSYHVTCRSKIKRIGSCQTNFSPIDGC